MKAECNRESAANYRVVDWSHVETIVHPERGQVSDEQPAATRKCILFVDDEQSIRRVGERALTQAGFDVLVAESGEQALALFALHQRSIELVILDLNMPQMSGIETFRKLYQAAPDVRVVLSSGYDPADATHLDPELIAVGFMQKPYRLASLLEKVKELTQSNQK